MKMGVLEIFQKQVGDAYLRPEYFASKKIPIFTLL